MTRWSISKHHGMWCAVERGWNYQSFPTWCEAMAYVQRQAQPAPSTITIEDPSGLFCDLTATITDRRRVNLKACGDIFILAHHEWKPLGEFLLAAAQHAKEHDAS